MAFGLKQWQEGVKKYATNFVVEMERRGLNSVYVYSILATLLPLVQGGEAAFIELAKTVGGNLLADWIQGKKEQFSNPHEHKKLIDDLMAEMVKHPKFAQEAQQAVNIVTLPVLATTLPTDERRKVVARLQDEQQLIQNGQAIQLFLTGPISAPGATIIVTSDEESSQQTARHRYLQNLINRYSSLILPPITENEANVRLNDIYIDLETTTENYRSREDRMGRTGRLQDAPKLSAIEAVHRHPKLVILGDPGGGKSTFVRYLVSTHARGLLENKIPEGWQKLYLPVVTILRDLTSRLHQLVIPENDSEKRRAFTTLLWEYWREQLEEFDTVKFETELRNTLEKGEVLLIFDGLDELETGMRQRVRGLIQSLQSSYSDSNRW